MEAFNPAVFTALVALIGVVIVVAALSSGAIERLGFPQVALFVGIGALLGPHALGVIDFPLSSAALGAIATLSLVLVLFTDSVSLDLKGLQGHARLAAVVLGPGTLLSSALVAVLGWWLLGLSPAAAAIVGAALASTDPVMMRGLLRLPGIPRSARYALGLESGLNDVVVLPIVLVAMVFLPAGGAANAGAVSEVLGRVFLVGPAVGMAVGWLAVRLLEGIRKRTGIRRDYESLYVLGIAFTAYAVAESLHGSGFMAAFTAGLAVAWLDVDLCDCFHDYGEATAEMLLLFSFVAFGTSLLWLGLEAVSPRALLFAVLALLVRTAVLHLTLPRREVEPGARRLITWFGPRALSSILLVLLPVFAGIPGAAALFPIVALVVLVSIGWHGTMLLVMTRRLRRAEPVQVAAPGAEAPGAGLPGAELVPDGVRITFAQLAALRAGGVAVHLIDVRKPNDFAEQELIAQGAIRSDPDRAVESAAARALPKHDWLVAYCA